MTNLLLSAVEPTNDERSREPADAIWYSPCQPPYGPLGLGGVSLLTSSVLTPALGIPRRFLHYINPLHFTPVQSPPPLLAGSEMKQAEEVHVGKHFKGGHGIIEQAFHSAFSFKECALCGSSDSDAVLKRVDGTSFRNLPLRCLMSWMANWMDNPRGCKGGAIDRMMFIIMSTAMERERLLISLSPSPSLLKDAQGYSMVLVRYITLRVWDTPGHGQLFLEVVKTNDCRVTNCNTRELMDLYAVLLHSSSVLDKQWLNQHLDNNLPYWTFGALFPLSPSYDYSSFYRIACAKCGRPWSELLSKC